MDKFKSGSLSDKNLPTALPETVSELHEMLKEGLEDVKEGRLTDAEVFFEELEKSPDSRRA